MVARPVLAARGGEMGGTESDGDLEAGDGTEQDLTLCHLSQPEYKYVDPICTFLFSALVLGTTLTILRDVLLVLMEGRDPPGPGDGENHPRVP